MARSLPLCTEMVPSGADVYAVRDERHDAHQPTGQRARQRKTLTDAGDQHRPQVVGQQGLGSQKLNGFECEL